MKLSFYGAARAVTGSCHGLRVNGKQYLIDCGLQQGRDETDNAAFPFDPAEVDAVLVTHAHIDHSGRLPLLCKRGFTGPIYCTRLTGELLSIMLRDSAHIQESDAQWQNQKGKRAGRPPLEPLYTLLDVEQVLQQIKTCDYDQLFDVGDGVQARFQDAGHLLGSSFIEVFAREGGETRKIVFSGDLGNLNQPIIRDPSPLKTADYVVMESTYGDRNHEVTEFDYAQSLAEVIEDTMARGGNVIIPSFAVGRTQELLYFIREIKEQGLVHTRPDFPVYIDSPLAREATRIFSGDLTGYLDQEARELVQDGIGMFSFPGRQLCATTEESRALNLDPTPKVIISASGMCDAGRIRHHLKHNLWRPECTVLFVGFQAVGSLGRHLLDGAESVRLFGEEIAVRARLVNFKGLSSHADRDHLLEWIGGVSPAPRHVFVVHGDAEVAPAFAARLEGMGLTAHAPLWQEEYDLMTNAMLAAGVQPPRKAPAPERESPAFQRARTAGKRLTQLIASLRGHTNRELNALADEIEGLLTRYRPEEEEGK